MMVNRTTLIAAASVVGVAAALLGYVHTGAPSSKTERESPVDDPKSTSDKRQQQEMAEDIAVLKLQLQQQAAELSTLRRVRSESPQKVTAEPRATEEPNLRDPAFLAARKQEWHDHMAQVKADFSLEPRDARWSSTTVNAIRDLASKTESLGDALQSVECHSKTCRVEIKENAKVAEQIPFFIQNLGNQLPSTQTEYIEGDHGERTMVLYLTNEAS